MNAQYALLIHLLSDPEQVSELAKNGFNSTFFKDEQYGQVYDLIFDKWITYQSTPTNDELNKINFKITSEDVPHTFQHCVDLIVEDAKKRFFGNLIRDTASVLVEENVEKAKELLLHKISKIPSFKKQEERSRDISVTTDDFLARYNFMEQHKGEIIGVPTGFKTIDELTMGLRNQWLVVVAGRNQQGKTWILTEWSKNMWQKGKNIAFFSCEMSVHQMEGRFHALAAGIDPEKLDKGTLTPEEKENLIKYTENIKTGEWGTLTLNDNPVSLANIDLEVQTMFNDGMLDVIVIDSVYRLGDADHKNQTDIARACKNMAKRYNIPVIVSIQLNREFAKANHGKSRTLSGGFYLAGTDAWNQDADLVLAINRPDIYADLNYSDFIMDKFRHGKSKNSIIKINLAEPAIKEEDYDEAVERINALENGTLQKSEPVAFTKVQDEINNMDFSDLQGELVTVGE